MALLVKKTGSAEYGTYAKVLIVGDTGAGKTRFGRTWPHPFYANCEGGLMSVARDGLPYTDIRTAGDLLELVQTLAQTPDVRERMLGAPVETIIIDTFDEVQRMLVRDRLKETRKDAMAIADWGWLGDQLRGIVRAVRNLDMNVILTCHIKGSTDEETGRVTNKPMVQGAMGDELSGYVDLAVLIKAQPVTRIDKNGETERRLVRVMQTYPDLNHPWIKDRSGQMPPEFEVNFTDDYPRMHQFVFGDAVALWKAEAAKAQEGVVQLERELALPPVDTPLLPDNPEFDVDGPDLDEILPKPEPSEDARADLASPDRPVVKTAAKKVAAKKAAAPEVVPEASAEVKVTSEPDLDEDIPMDPPPKAKAAPVAVPAHDSLICEVCGGPIENQDQSDMSQIRFRKRMCKNDFNLHKTSKR